MAERQFGTYLLDRLIGRGSAGEVWLARDTVADRTVALKILSTTAAQDPDYRRRFEREASIGARLDNPHVVPIHTFGEHQGRLFLDMAHIPGIDVAGRLRVGPMDTPAAVDFIAQVAQALDAAHTAGLVHRDVKPANIILHPSGFAYLIDFGIARASNQTTITATGFTVGTLAYMAPERFTGTADARSDIYSLTCVLYECLTAQRPFGDTDPVQQLHAHLREDPPHADSAPAALNEVIARGMAKKPQDRYQSAGALAAAALAAIGMAQPISRTPPQLEPPAAPTRTLPPIANPARARPGSGPRPGAAPQPARTMTRSGPSAGPEPHPTRVPAGPCPSTPPPAPHPTRVLPAPNPRIHATPELVKAPVPQHNPLFTSRFVKIAVLVIILAALAFALIAGCTALLAGGGVKIETPATPATSPQPTASAALTTPATPPPTSEPGQPPLSFPTVPGFTLTFRFPVPTGLTFPPLQVPTGGQ